MYYFTNQMGCNLQDVTCSYMRTLRSRWLPPLLRTIAKPSLHQIRKKPLHHWASQNSWIKSFLASVKMKWQQEEWAEQKFYIFFLVFPFYSSLINNQTLQGNRHDESQKLPMYNKENAQQLAEKYQLGAFLKPDQRLNLTGLLNHPRAHLQIHDLRRLLGKSGLLSPRFPPLGSPNRDQIHAIALLLIHLCGNRETPRSENLILRADKLQKRKVRSWNGSRAYHSRSRNHRRGHRDHLGGEACPGSRSWSHLLGDRRNAPGASSPGTTATPGRETTTARRSPPQPGTPPARTEVHSGSGLTPAPVQVKSL